MLAIRLALSLIVYLGTSIAQDCFLKVPNNPLSEEGLATPYLLSGPGCSQASSATFAEAAIIEPNGKISIYHPLVIDDGTKPAAPPVKVKLPKGSIVGIWFGSNADTVQLYGVGAVSCTTGTPASLFGQFSYCNARKFFQAVNAAIAQKKLSVPQLGIGKDGLPCPTTRDFRVVDQDQSDNLDTSYLLLPNGQTAQFTKENVKKFPTAKKIDNGSDNRLLNSFFQPALGCGAFTAPSLDDPKTQVRALALNEIQAKVFQKAPKAKIPAGDPMVLDNGSPNLKKLNLYRSGVFQNSVSSVDIASTTRYCLNILQNGIPEINLPASKRLFQAFASPKPLVANNLYTFLAARSVETLEILDCAALTNITSPWTLVFSNSSSPIVIDASINVPAKVSSILPLNGLQPAQVDDL